ncbi:MAG: penicillin-binding protein activator LpoB [Phycisphaerales bacterium]|nr:penicillin-binding protein activator LpoB [Phycisphaerales bacterium]
MKSPTTIVLALALTASFSLTGCNGGGGGGSVNVDRIDPDSVTDLSGRWNDTDARLVAQKMVKESLEWPWYRSFRDEHGRKPVLIVGPIANMTRDYIDTAFFTKEIEREFIRGGEVRIVAMRGREHDAVVSEILAQQEFASPETAKRLGQALGGDFVLIGRLGSIIQTSEDGKRKIRFFQTDLEVINVETTEKVWIGTKKIKKDVVRRGHKP